MTPIVGERLGPYEILGQQGRGGMGLVYRAWDGRLRREVAIKLLHHEYPVPGSRERFLQEARAASALNHPHICTVFDIGEKDGSPYLVMELMVGETLKERIEHSAIPVDEMVRYGVEIADALGAAHAGGIVHRDIKPANIFLVEQPDGGRQTKVLDFGLAKIERRMAERLGIRFDRDPDRRAHATSDGMTVGTVAYMSPEQARGEELDGRSDLFSLGVVMYEMATRRTPFVGSSNAVTFVQLLHHQPEPIRDWNDLVPRALDKIILHLLEKEPERRFQTAAEVSAALRELAAKNGGSWSKRGLPAVPLVRTSDPVARAKMPMRSGVGVEVKPDSDGAGVLRPLAHSRELDSMAVVLPERVVLSEESVSAVGIDLAGAAAWDSGAARASRRWEERGRGGAVRMGALGAVVSDIAREEEAEVAPPGLVARRRRRRLWAGAAVVGVAMCMGVALLAGRWLRPPMIGPNDWVMVTAIENRTGDRTLDGTVAQGLEIALAESPDVALRGGEEYLDALRRMGGGVNAAATPALARRAAQVAGVKAYLYGSLDQSGGHGDGAGYTISVKMLDVGSDRELASVEESAAGREQIPAAIDRVVASLRAEAGLGRWREGGAVPVGADALARFDVPLGREATGNVDALHAYSLGLGAMAQGRSGDALSAFQTAVRLDPRFVQALMQMAWIYRGQHAEVLSAEAARLAENASVMTLTTSTHTALLAQFSYEVNATGDLDRAGAVIRRFVALYPHDAAGARGLARSLRLQGRFGEALGVTERGLKDAPFDGDLYGQAEFSLIAMDRYDAALGIEQRAEQMGVPVRALHGAALTAAYLAGKEDRLASAIEWVTRPPYDVSSMAAYGLYLDNTGQMAAGTTLWRMGGAGAGWMLAQGALDRALAGDCGVALEMARGAGGSGAAGGMTVGFNMGMAGALCGDKGLAEGAIAGMTKDWGEASAVQGWYLPDLRATVALGAHDPRGAVEALRGARPYDLVSMTPYLRGLAHGELQENQLAVVDFQTVLGHRGVAITGGSNVYPMAQIGLARAYAASGDRVNSARAYRGFMELWGRGDVGEKVRVEAEVGSR